LEVEKVSSASDDDSYRVGRGKPPKEHQFKKGQSGCPGGGHQQRRAKKAKAKEKEKSPGEFVVQWFTEKKKVRVNGRTTELSRLEMAFAQLEEEAFVKREPAARKLIFDVAQRNGWLKAPPAKSRGFVLVVNPILTAEEWAKQTEGERLPKDPLHGIPGAEGLLDPAPRRRHVSDDES
jgi:hypothetical protein